MFNKKLLFGVLAFSLLPMFSASAADMMEDDSNADLIYLRLGYQAAYVGKHNITDAKAAAYSALPTSTISVDASKDYKPKYAMNFFGGSLGIGKSFGGETRAELEIAANNDIEIDNKAKLEYFNNIAGQTDQDVFVNKGFNLGVASLNFYYDLDSGKPGLTKYVGGGVGVARVKFSSSPTTETVTYPLALQFKAGVQVKMNDMLPVYVGYKLVYLLPKQSDEIKPIASKTAADAKNTKLESSYLLHNLDLGFTIIR